MQGEEAEYGWGVGSVVALLLMVAVLVFVPLGMGPGLLQPPSIPMLLVFPLFLAAVFIFLSQASKTN